MERVSSPAESHAGAFSAPTAEIADRIRLHLDDLLKDPLFANSKRTPSFLTYVVRKALEGTPDAQIKERTLGIEVFGRSPLYDTNDDPIVRIAASEVRKKLAQYYYAHHESDVQIQIPVGSYLPRFQFLQKATDSSSGAKEARFTKIATEEPVLEPANAPSSLSSRPEVDLIEENQTVRKSRRRLAIWCSLGFVALVVLFGSSWQLIHRQSVEDRFWGSFSEPGGSVLIVPGAVSPPPDALSQYHFEAASVASQDADITSRLRSEFAVRKVRSSQILSTEASLSDLRAQPFVLVGAFNNIWTQRLSQQLPFAFERSADRRFGRIVERANPNHTWTVDFSVPNARIAEDYGVVARFTDASTGQNVVVIAGISAEGTLAGGEALLVAGNLEQILRATGGASHFEVVYKTQTVEGHSGPPVLVATKTW